MNKFILVIILSLLSVTFLSCTRDTNYTLSATDVRILILKDKEMMEYLIDCSITRQCTRIPVMELLYNKKAFLLEAGTNVTMTDRPFSFSHAKSIHVLEGVHSGQDGWVYDRMLYRDPNIAHYQMAFARVCRTATE
jgi:hypothetical protein